MSDEDLYLEATNEVEEDKKDPALWAKVMALTEGDQDKAKYKYIKLRVEQLSKKKKEEKPTFTKKIIDEFDIKYMPISEFSKIKLIPENKVTQMIRDGFYVGQIKDNKWFISRDELGKDKGSKHTFTASTYPKEDTKHEYIPVEEFAKYKNLNTEKAVSMIREGFYQGRIIDNKWYVSASEINGPQNTENHNTEMGFAWWQIWAWLGLTLGNISVIAQLQDMIGFAITLVLINSILMVMILKYNKYAFLIATILSLNPLLWIINGIYLKNRWNHPKVNNRAP